MTAKDNTHSEPPPDTAPAKAKTTPKAKSKKARKQVDAFTDGACSGNPGPGGFGVVLRFRTSDGKAIEREIAGAHPRTTNNQMELYGAVAALRALKEPCDVTLTTDSEYVVKGMTKWVADWMSRGWRTAGRKPVKNRGIWEALVAAAMPHDVKWLWVRGHAGHAENERCDELARTAIDALRGGQIDAITDLRQDEEF